MQPDVVWYLASVIWLLASVMVREAGVLGEDGMLAIGHCVMNRVASDKFPDKVVEVIEQPGQWNGRGAWGGNEEALARRVLRRDQNKDPTGGALYALSEQDRVKLGFPEGDTVVEDGRYRLHLYRAWPGG